MLTTEGISWPWTAQMRMVENWPLASFYENDKKRLAHGTPAMCQNSKKYLFLLKLIESSIKESTNIDHPPSFLRAHFLYGACTQKHKDSFRDNWYSYIMAFDEGYELSILLFPNFRTSVVEVSGSNYIPLSYSPLNGFLAIAFEVHQSMRRVILHPDAYKTCISLRFWFCCGWSQSHRQNSSCSLGIQACCNS